MQSSGYLELVRGNRAFRLLWSGQIVSLLGDWFTLIASATLIGSLTGSAVAIGGLFVVRMLATFFASPLAGVIADRYNRKHLLIATDLLRALVTLGFLLVHSGSQVWLLYVLSAVQLALSGVFFPTRNAILPSLVSERELGAANALSAASWSVMLAFGAALGGLVSGRFGVHTAFVVDAITYLVSAAILMRIPYRHECAEGREGTVAAVGREFRDGLRYLEGHRDVLVTACSKAAFGLIMGGMLQVVQVRLAQEVFVLGEGGGTSLGLFYAVGGVGTGLGPIVARRFTGDRPKELRRAIAVAYGLAIAGLLVMAPLATFPIVLLGTFLRTFGGGINWVFSTHLLMQTVSSQVRGRVFSTEFALFTLAMAVGTGVGGWVLDVASVSVSLVIVSVAGLLLVPGSFWTGWVLTRPGSRGDQARG